MDSPTFEFEFDQPWAITLSLSAHYAVCQRPRAVARSSLRDSYVLNLACLQSCYAASFSAPSNSLSLFDKQGLQLMTSIISAHSENITLIRSPPYLSTHRGNDVLLSSGKDGLLKVWDIRSQYDCVLQFRLNNRQTFFPVDDKRGILSFDVAPNGLCLAAGTELKGDEAHLIFWDVRNAASPTHVSTSAHSDDITSLNFHPTKSHVLLSGSTDGLLCTTDTREPNEDESGLHVGNWGCSIAKAGWTGVGYSAPPAVWAHSDMHTLSTWSEELDRIHDYGDIRKPAIANQWCSEYFIDAIWLASDHTLAPGLPSLGMWVGSNEGDVALLELEGAQLWKLERLFSGSHTDVVRSVIWDEQNSVAVTGGEDSCVNVWFVERGTSSTSASTEQIGDDSESMDIDELASRPVRGSKRERGRDEPPEIAKRLKSEIKAPQNKDA